jgi:CDP-paratose 2-epimerase
MASVVVTGSGGLIGSEAARHYAEQGHEVIGLDNDMRAAFFGPDASTAPVTEALAAELDGFHPVEVDIRDRDAVERAFRRAGRIELVVHAAAQPSHDWAASAPHVDFAINATGTLNLLEATRALAPEAVFAFMSTNKVYGDRPNGLPLVEEATRLELPPDHRYHDGIDTSMSIDRSTHSLFGVSKVAADLLVQEYGRYFGLATVAFRAGCLTGARHAGARLHGFLSYLLRCTVSGRPYTVYGYGGKQVRDNLHAHDVVAAIDAFRRAPTPGAVYNLGGGRDSNCSMLEAIALCEAVAGRRLDWTLSDEARVGDHRWWISDVGEFRRDHPGWAVTWDVERILLEMYAENAERWMLEPAV